MRLHFVVSFSPVSKVLEEVICAIHYFSNQSGTEVHAANHVMKITAIILQRQHLLTRTLTSTFVWPQATRLFLVVGMTQTKIDRIYKVMVLKTVITTQIQAIFDYQNIIKSFNNKVNEKLWWEILYTNSSKAIVQLPRNFMTALTSFSCALLVKNCFNKII